MNKIIIKGARVHNLKNIDVEIPKDKLVVFTGISGSGKSSLAFDTIYAEGQRRYVESLSAYARQFLGVMDKPDVDLIEGLSPAISIDQKSGSHNPRSTVGTITEIYDFLRLLFARVGHPHCPNCGREISSLSREQIINASLSLGEKRKKPPVRVLILAPLIRDRKGEYRDLFEDLRKKGYRRVRVDGQVFSLDEEFVLLKTNKHTIEAVIDRLILDKNLDRSRLSQSLETALKLGEGEVIVSEVLDASFEFPEKPKKFEEHLFSEKFACPVCNISIAQIEPRTFSFNSPHGACPTCSGIGNLLKVDPELILNPRLSISEGGILPFSRLFDHETWFSRILKEAFKTHGIDIKNLLGALTDEQRKILLYGTGEEVYTVSGRNRFGRSTTVRDVYLGIIAELERRYQETDSDFVRAEIEKYMRWEVCPQCQGGRLKKEALSITIDEKTIVDISNFAMEDLGNWLEQIWHKFNEREETIAKPIFKELKSRVKFLLDVGLDYLTIGRSAVSLAGGEAQRIRLASQIGSGLSGVLYVLDEPSIGLHQRDNQRLIHSLQNLRELGNTVIVVEHDREMMESADWIFDFGPGAGENGGKVIAQGTPSQIKSDPNSLTGKYLSEQKQIGAQSSEHSGTTRHNHLVILGASDHNLKKIDVTFPLGKLICITGVSGSGKSTLIVDTLYHALMLHFNPFHKEKPGTCKGLLGAEKLNKTILIDQSPIGRTPRSNPATYTGAFTYIRDTFAQTQEARIKGYKPGRFSFNVRGGRCEACQGEGQIKIEMQFLPDVYVTCEVCQGARYTSDALEVNYKGKNIADVLQMTVDEATEFFTNIPPLHTKLLTLKEVGLGYIRLGQPAPTLSGGEAQRVKLSAELSKKSTGHTLYLLDEPTTGLHFADLEKLLYVLRRLVANGNTVLVIEHNLDIIKNADWIIDLGPEGGDKGGQIVAQGTPKEVSLNDKSYTGQFLKKVL
ncbi:excinuclease ABC subunit UvrA [Candidatus Microgenomates bacterium]|nr:excinuclease ABC subunit UvrA [Candidatus Microgenomates bacterium]